jgi:biotin carboxylase
MEKIAFIGTPDLLLDRAKNLDLKTLVVQKKDHLNQKISNLVDKALICDYDDPAELPHIIDFMKSNGVDRCVAVNEVSLIPCARVNDHLSNTTLNFEQTILLKDKARMRDRLKGTILGNVSYYRVDSQQDLQHAYDQLPNGFILKPRDGVGSRNVITVKGKDDLSAAANLVNLIAEEYIGGDEFSIETFSINGRHYVLAITRKILFEAGSSSRFVERGHAVTISDNRRLFDIVSSAIVLFLDTIGIMSGPAHTEIKIDNNEVHIIESHNRPGGDRILDLVMLATGIDTYELIVKHHSGGDIKLPDQPAVSRSAGILFFDPPLGQLEGVYGMDKLKLNPLVKDVQIQACAGDLIKRPTCSSDRRGHFVACADLDSQIDMIGELNRLQSLIRFKVK